LAVARAERQPSSVAVLFIDLEHFKVLNERRAPRGRPATATGHRCNEPCWPARHANAAGDHRPGTGSAAVMVQARALLGMVARRGIIPKKTSMPTEKAALVRRRIRPAPVARRSRPEVLASPAAILSDTPRSGARRRYGGGRGGRRSAGSSVRCRPKPGVPVYKVVRAVVRDAPDREHRKRSKPRADDSSSFARL
jgi:hypothetical protein